MKLQISPEQLLRLQNELTQAGEVEIGGMLFGEHLGGADFRLHDFSIQRSGGDHACFTRDPAMHADHIARFHEETGHDYTRFNYLGEWHSHPLFPVKPSIRDVHQMQSIAGDPQFGLLQAVLLITRIVGERLELSGTLFQKRRRPTGIQIVIPGLQLPTSTIQTPIAGNTKMTMLDRFKEKDALIGALINQKIINGDRAAAEAFAEQGELLEFPKGRVLIEQGGSDRDVYFLLTGRGAIIINKVRFPHFRNSGQSVGEMSAVDPLSARIATIEADQDIVAWKVSHTHFLAVLNNHKDLWPKLTVDMVGRLHERNKYIKRANPKPVVFIMSSREAIPASDTIRAGIDHVADVVQWTDENVFPPGSYPLDALAKAVENSDFGIAIAEPDDIVTMRGNTSSAPRDNVVFEVGFFMSRLGRNRTMLLVPRRDVQLPSDWKGMTPIPYEPTDDYDQMPQKLGGAITRIKNHIQRIGPRTTLLETN